jgi:hypothetical protein
MDAGNIKIRADLSNNFILMILCDPQRYINGRGEIGRKVREQ